MNIDHNEDNIERKESVGNNGIDVSDVSRKIEKEIGRIMKNVGNAMQEQVDQKVEIYKSRN